MSIRDAVPGVPAADVPDDAFLLDVREPDEWEAGHVPGARHIPLGQLGARAEEIPRTAAIYVICRSGALFLWAEDADGPATAPSRPGRPSRAPRAHPFAATADAVAEAVAEHAGPAADLVVKAVDDELTLWLAATADGPLASPDLIRAPENQPPAGARADLRASRRA